MGNAKSIDLFAINDQGSRFTIQVKALRSPNYFLIDLERVQDACYYVFVVLNKSDVPPDYYIVPACDLRSDPAKFGKWFADYKKMPGIHPKDLGEYCNNWTVLPRNWESQQSQMASSNVPDLESMSVTVDGKSGPVWVRF